MTRTTLVGASLFVRGGYRVREVHQRWRYRDVCSFAPRRSVADVTVVSSPSPRLEREPIGLAARFNGAHQSPF